MLIYRHINVVPKLFFRNYSKKLNEMFLNPKLVHQEVMRYVSPYSRINISSDLFLKIRPADVHTYPNGDAFIAELHGDNIVKNCTAAMSVTVSDDEKEVNVELRKLDPSSNFHCELALPIKAEILINSKESVNIHSIQSDNVDINTEKDINGKDIKSEVINLFSTGGRIRMKGLLLGHKTFLRTLSRGNIYLDKAQGDELVCKTNQGKISVNSCYVLKSKFETDYGDLELNNIHRNTKVQVNGESKISMSGVHGNLDLSTNGGSLDIHFSELEGESFINANSLAKAKINISEEVERDSDIQIECSGGIALNGSLANSAQYLSIDSKTFANFEKPLNYNKVSAKIDSSNPLELGKLSWEDSLKAKFNMFNKN